MFKRLIAQWKEEWWAKHESNLITEYAVKEASMKEDLADHLEVDRQAFSIRLEESQQRLSSITDKNERLKARDIELEELEKRIAEKKIELSRKNEELLTQIRIIEGKNAPSGIWEVAFTAGFSKAWDMMIPLMMEGVYKSKKAIQDAAIEETIRRNNANKTNN